jgi:hypothetical protein
MSGSVTADVFFWLLVKTQGRIICRGLKLFCYAARTCFCKNLKKKNILNYFFKKQQLLQFQKLPYSSNIKALKRIKKKSYSTLPSRTPICSFCASRALCFSILLFGHWQEKVINYFLSLDQLC